MILRGPTSLPPDGGAPDTGATTIGWLIRPWKIRRLPSGLELSRQTQPESRDFGNNPAILSATYGCIGVFGLILASVGLAGVTAYSVTQRRREIGIRIALGARSADVLGLLMKAWL